MRRSHLFTPAALVVVSLALSSCSDSGGGTDPDDTTPPTVIARTVTDGETDVGLIEELAVVFSEDMDDATIDQVSAYVAGRSPTTHLSYDPDERRLSIVPDTLYAQSVWHEFVLTDSVTDPAGNSLSPDTTEFQTGTLDCAHLSDRLEPNDPSASTRCTSRSDTTYHTLSVCGSDHGHLLVHRHRHREGAASGRLPQGRGAVLLAGRSTFSGATASTTRRSGFGAAQGEPGPRRLHVPPRHLLRGDLRRRTRSLRALRPRGHDRRALPRRRVRGQRLRRRGDRRSRPACTRVCGAARLTRTSTRSTPRPARPSW